MQVKQGKKMAQKEEEKKCRFDLQKGETKTGIFGLKQQGMRNRTSFLVAELFRTRGLNGGTSACKVSAPPQGVAPTW